jgi:hypothetical protein
MSEALQDFLVGATVAGTRYKLLSGECLRWEIAQLLLLGHGLVTKAPVTITIVVGPCLSAATYNFR